MHPVRSLPALLVLALLLVAGCTGQPNDPTVGGPDAAASAAATSGSAAAEVLAFQATTVGGSVFDGGEYAGKDLMLWFWAPW